MNKPIAVFDAGIGSYAIVAAIQRRLPRQDIVYFADRASFPYGGKDADALLATMRRTIRFLERYDPSAVVVASNAPSIMVLDAVRPGCAVPLHGVIPPLAEALSLTRSGHVGIMGVQSLIRSEALGWFVGRHARPDRTIACLNASPMVELVETGAFLFDPAGTQHAVDTFATEIMQTDPAIDVLTLSSTHLPWLRLFFETALPNCHFLDPADAVVKGLGQGTAGTGHVRALVTVDESYDLETFRRMLARLGVEQELEVVDPAA